MLRSICGPRTLPPAPRCEDGSGMILLAGKNFDAAIRKRFIDIATDSANYAPSLKEDGLHSFLRRTMRLITTLLF
jgi:hypothetical protein